MASEHVSFQLEELFEKNFLSFQTVSLDEPNPS